MNKKVNFGIIGCGGVANQHAIGILSNKKAKLVGICDFIKERANEFSEKYNCKKVYYDYRELIKDPEVEAVVIATSDEVHAEISIYASKFKKHVLVEKPLAISVEEAKKMIESAEENDIKIMCGQSLRFYNRYRRIIEIIKMRKIGKPIFARFVHMGAGSSWTPENPVVQQNKNNPFFLLLHNGIHSIDMIGWLFGELPETVYTMGYKKRKDIPFYEYFVVNLGFSGGRSAIIEENRIMDFDENYPPHSEFYIIGENGIVVYTHDNSGMYVYKKNGIISYPLHSQCGEQEENPFVKEIDEFIHCIIENREPEIPIRFSGNVLCAVLSAIESFKNNRCEKVKYVF